MIALELKLEGVREGTDARVTVQQVADAGSDAGRDVTAQECGH